MYSSLKGGLTRPRDFYPGFGFGPAELPCTIVGYIRTRSLLLSRAVIWGQSPVASAVPYLVPGGSQPVFRPVPTSMLSVTLVGDIILLLLL